MAQTDVLKRYLDAGIAFTKMTQERAEAIVRELVGAGEVGAEQATSTVAELVERSRENTDRLRDTMRAEINAQVANLGLATRDDVDALRREISALRRNQPGSAGAVEVPGTPAPSATKSSAKKSSAKRSSAKKSPATKSPATKSDATTSPATTSPAKKSTATKSTATKSDAKKSAASETAATKKATAKKAAPGGRA